MDLLYMDADMYRAATNGEIEIFMECVGNLPFPLTPSKNTVLHINITSQTGGSTDFVEKILDLCPSLLLQPNIKGETLLHIAARHGLDAVVETLLQRAKSQDYDQELERGIDAASQMVRMMDSQKETALHEAVRYHHVGVVQLLTRADPDFPYFANEAGETPLYLAVERGYHDLVFEILATCTSPAHGGPNGRKSLHAAVIFNDEEIMRKLIEIKGSLTAEADDQGWTPLHYAARYGYASVVKWLLHYDSSAAYMGDRDGKKTALHIAASRGHIDVMNEILSCCPDCCELVDNRGWNIFHIALESNSDQAIKYILENSSLRWLALEKGHTGLGEQVIQGPSNRNHGGLKDFKETHLIVATLIATVTFTAGFTMPGGLNSEEGPAQGAAILTGSKAFRAFVITNTFALCWSSSAVAFHIFRERNEGNKLDNSQVHLLLLITFEALIGMVLAFTTGTYAVLEHSSAFGVGIAICIAGSGLSCWLGKHFDAFDALEEN